MAKHRQIPIRKGFVRLGISTPTGYKLIADGILATYKIGNRRFTTDEFIDAAIDKLTTKARGK